MIDPEDSIFVIGAAIFTTLLSEGNQIWFYTKIGISWLLIYR